MNELKVIVNFEEQVTHFSKKTILYIGDYNSTKLIFEFDKKGGEKYFEMVSPSGKVFVRKIENDELLLDEFCSPFLEIGKYIFEISLYTENSRLTSKHCFIEVEDEKVKIDRHKHNYEEVGSTTEYYQNDTHRIATTMRCTDPECNDSYINYSDPISCTYEVTSQITNRVTGEVEITEVCSGCGHSRTRTETPEHEHQYIEQVDASYTDNGETHTKSVTMKCPDDGETTVITTTESHSLTFSHNDDDGHHYTCVCGNEDVRPHTWDEGREFEDEIVYTCTYCGRTYEEAIENNPPIEEHTHSFVLVEGSKTEERCSCGATQAHTHNFDTVIYETEFEIVKECVCGEKYTEKKEFPLEEEHEHTYVYSSRKDADVCSCGSERIHEHNWVAVGDVFEGKQGYECICGASKSEVIPHEHDWAIDMETDDEIIYYCRVCLTTKTESKVMTGGDL